MQVLPSALPSVEIGTTQQEIPVTRNNITWTAVNHANGVGFIKRIEDCVVKPSKEAGFMAWLQRADKRQVTIFPNGKIWCEQQ